MRNFVIILLVTALVLAGLLYMGGGAKKGDEPVADSPAVTVEQTEAGESGSDAVLCSFETSDLDGNPVDSGIFADHSLTMINFWEPWCGPCVAEMPDLQKLYEDYSDRGFLLLGVFSTEAGVRETVSDTGVKYPILYYAEGFDYFQTGYVPTTIFVNSAGEMVGSVQIGAKSYEDWAEIIEGLL